ncbi:MAG: trehalose-phosphatase [Desulfotomaculales bacterium]
MEGLLARAAAAERGYLLLDYDGTLVPIAGRPDLARPDPELVELLGRLAGMPGWRVAVVSGRTVAELHRLLPVPGLYLVGVHGAERATPGEGVECTGDPAFREALRRLVRAAGELARPEEGFVLEDKGLALALHYRQAAPSRAAEVGRGFLRLARAGLPAGTWRLLAGKKVLEVRPAGTDKGGAVAGLLAGYPGALALYFGDDVTDEDAFRTVRRLGGIGVLVSPVARPTAARYRLDNPSRVREFLGQLLLRRAETGGGGRGLPTHEHKGRGDGRVG